MLSSNETNIDLQAKYVNWVGMMFIRCYCFLMIPLSIIGHSLSIFVFTRRSLRTNPCIMYFRAATVFGLLTSCFILPMRLIQSGYIGIDPTVHSMYICKIVWFLLYSIRSLSCWLVALASIDRYLCSSPSMKKRAWSSTRVASKVIPLTILIVFLGYIHIPIIFKIYIIPSTNEPACHGAGPPGSYRKILSFFNLIVYGVSPSLCMLSFGMLTLHNIYRKQGFNVIFSYNSKICKTRLPEKQLLRMLFIQVFVYSVSGMTFSIGFIFIAMNRNREKSVLDIAQENLIIAFIGMFSNIGPCLSFYLFTLSSRLFRKQLKTLFDRFLKNKIQLNDDYSLTTQVNSTTKQEYNVS